MVYRELGGYRAECGVLGEEFESHRGSQNVGDKKMPQENYRRII